MSGSSNTFKRKLALLHQDRGSPLPRPALSAPPSGHEDGKEEEHAGDGRIEAEPGAVPPETEQAEGDREQHPDAFVSVLVRGDIKMMTLSIWRTSLQKYAEIILPLKCVISSTFDPRTNVAVLPSECSEAKAREWIGSTAVAPDCAFVNASWMISLFEGLGELRGGPGAGGAAVLRDAVLASRRAPAFQHALQFRLRTRVAQPEGLDRHPEGGNFHVVENSEARRERVKSEPKCIDNRSSHYSDNSGLCGASSAFAGGEGRGGGAKVDMVPDGWKAFACVRSGTPSGGGKRNALVIEKLSELQHIYEIEGDTFRALAYKRACSQLGSMEEVTDADQLVGRKGFGDSIVEKIREILASGQLGKLSALRESVPSLDARLAFADIWGVGPTTASRLAALGYKSIADLRERGLHELNEQQKIGLKLYEELLQRMNRAEVEAVSEVVRRHALAIMPGVECITCGSYRRGKPTSGDVDIIIFPPRPLHLHQQEEQQEEEEEGASAFAKLLPQLVSSLHKAHFLTDDLSMSNEHDHHGARSTYMGVCKLPDAGGEKHLHRRLDIKTYPRRFEATALLYFTGSDHFNRSMRLFADKTGFDLSDQGLFRCKRIVRRDENGKRVVTKLSRVQIPCRTEADVFAALGLPYKEPSERNCLEAPAAEAEAEGERNAASDEGDAKDSDQE